MAAAAVAPGAKGPCDPGATSLARSGPWLTLRLGSEDGRPEATLCGIGVNKAWGKPVTKNEQSTKR